MIQKDLHKDYRLALFEEVKECINQQSYHSWRSYAKHGDAYRIIGSMDSFFRSWFIFSPEIGWKPSKMVPLGDGLYAIV